MSSNARVQTQSGAGHDEAMNDEKTALQAENEAASPEVLAGRIQAVIDWFETVPAKARSGMNNELRGHYVKAADWRVIRSELNQIARHVRAIPPAPSPREAEICTCGAWSDRNLAHPPGCPALEHIPSASEGASRD